MREFVYRAIDGNGASLAGNIQADTLGDAQIRLKAMHPYLISVKEKPASQSQSFFQRGKKISLKELTIFTRQIALMLGAGMSLRSSLEAVSKQPISGELKGVILGIIADAEAGASFSETLSRRPKIFFPFYISMVKTGESAGILHQTLERLSNHMDAEMLMRQKIKSAFIYPAVMAGVAVVVLLVMALFVLPRFQTIFRELNAPLPMVTQVILGISDTIRHFWWVVGGVAGSAFFIGRRFWGHLDIQERVGHFIWRLPLTNSTLIPVEMARFCRSISLLDEGGVPILQALQVIAGTLRSPALKSGIEQAVIGLEGGQPLAFAFERTRVFPDFLIQMLGVGEKTGQLAAVMLRLAEYYDQQVEVLLERATALIEPAMIILLSLVIGVIVVSMLLPIFGLSEAFSG